jgi:hypothetical protein
MSKRIVLALVALMTLPAAAFSAEGAWFDMSKCAMCQPLMQTPGLMEGIHHEQLPLSKGVVTVTTVGDEHLKAYRQAHAQMEGIVARVQKGEKLPLCGSCTALFQLMPKGVEQDFVETQHGDVWILTSGNPAVAAELQSWAKRNNEEMAKMMSATKKPAKM